MLSTLGLIGGAGAAAWYVHEKSLRRTHPTAGGLHESICLPHVAEFELWHNALSLCSKKVRMCLDELGVPWVSHHVDLIETGSYQTLSREFLAVNPAALVPVLVHNGHPVYESHEIIRYAADHAKSGVALVPSPAGELAVMEHWIRKSSLTGDDPTAAVAESAGNCVPGLTVPLFAAMIADVPVTRIFEGLLFHRLKQRPASFFVLKAMGLRRLPSLAPAMRIIRESRSQMDRHLDELEAHLARTGAPWIAGSEFSLADVSWAVIFDRLREADWTGILASEQRPCVSDWWARIRERPAYHSSMLGRMEHPLVRKGTETIRSLKIRDEGFRGAVYGV